MPIGRLLGLGPQRTTRTTTSTPTRPTEVAEAVSDLISRSRAFADQPFEAYDQPRIAGFTPDELAGFEAARGVAATSGALAPLTSELVREGVAAARGLATRLPDTDLSGYMSPYTQAVLDPALRDIQERAAQERLRLGQQSARTGAFGGSRQAIAEAELEGRTQRTLGDLSARERANAYNQALAQFRLDQERIPQLYTGALSNVGTGLAQTSARLGAEVNPLLQIGGAQRARTQAELDFERQQFEEERDYPLRGIEVLRSVTGLPAASLGIGTTGTITETTPGRNPLLAIGGSLLAGGAGGPIGSALSSFGNTLGLSFLGGRGGGGSLGTSDITQMLTSQAGSLTGGTV